MGFWKALFGGTEETPEQQEAGRKQRNFELLKYDGVKAAKMGQLDYAVKCYREALKLNDDPEVHDYLAQALVRLSQFEEALAELQILAGQAPDNQNVLMQMAHVAYLMEDYDRMAELCQQLQAMAPESAAACYLGAQAALGHHQPAEAVSLLTRAIGLRDDYAEAYLLRGRTWLTMGQLEQAAADAQWLSDSVGDQEDVMVLSGRVAVARGQVKEALAICDHVLEQVNPFCTEALRLRAHVRQELGDTEGAAEDMARLREQDPELPQEDIEQQVRQAYSAANPLGL
ncbi:MAG: tetratricopeptide repeat protein [Prevotella sp.]|nr:tetratricopeptide repeat protein [Prevotella sp.]